MNTTDRITLEPGKRGGRPCVSGLRISVYDVLAMLAEGMAEAEILEDFPELEPADIRACLAYAARREQSVVKLVAP
ncbi:MAG: DUF433 domain-containing protein [Sulfuritalea sp.]|nr:DUF433 domain-containing protein [Sulfuritalea sp.]